MQYTKITDGCLTYSIEKGREIPAGFHEVVEELPPVARTTKPSVSTKPATATPKSTGTSVTNGNNDKDK